MSTFTIRDHVAARRHSILAAAAGFALAVTVLPNQPAKATLQPTDRVKPAAVASDFCEDPQWTLAWEDDFNTLNKDNWGVYNGPGNGKTGPRSASNTFGEEGNLILRTAPIDGVCHGAGVSSRDAKAQKYGKFVLRARFEPGYGVRAVGLLWPAQGWPPEVDFFEINARNVDRDAVVIANHYRNVDGQHRVDQRRVAADYTQWHTIAVEWTPDALRFFLDGAQVAEITDRVPQQPMWLGMQTAQGVISRGIVPDVTKTPKIDFVIDKVEVCTWNGATT